jgi:hypothetical protein
MMEPWICPRCGHVWAYWVVCCTCVSSTISTTDEVIITREHYFVYTAGDNRTPLHCMYCGILYVDWIKNGK